MWQWLVHSDAGLLFRLCVGISIFVIFAILDLRKNGPNATRWREYLFLLACAIAAMIYGIINDQITSRISWEYFYFGKGLDTVLGPQLPPDPAKLHYQAIKVGMKATWTVGLIIGVALLLANNPSPRRPRLSYARLFSAVAMIFIITIIFATAFGVSGYLGFPAHFSQDFYEMLLHNEFRPYHFMAVFGVHLGGYVGGLLGCVIAVLYVRNQRRKTQK